MNRRSFFITGAKALAITAPVASFFSGSPTSSRTGQDAANANRRNEVAQLLPPASPEKMPAPRELPWSLPSHAVELALQDVAVLSRRYGEHVGKHVRWLWVQSGSTEEWQSAADALNKVSRASAPAIPALVGGVLARVDLRVYWPRAADLAEVLGFWERFAFDPYFSLLFTAGSLKVLTEEKLAGLKTQSFRDLHSWDEATKQWVATGKRGWVERSLTKIKDVVVERINAPHLHASGIEKLQAWTGSLAPVVHSGYFETRALSTIKDRDKIDGKDKENVFSTIYGGLYDELSGIRKSSVKGRSDLDQLFLDLGVGDGREGYKALFDRLRSDKAAVLIHSNVTNKRRRVRAYPVLSTIFGVVMVTEDLRDRDIDVDADALRDVVNSKVFAYEVIWVAQNGHQKFAVFGADGQLLEEAGFDVVADHDLPRPVTTRLQAAISCIRCHGPYDGWQPFKNDLLARLRMGTIIFKNVDEEDRIRGQHAWQIDGAGGVLQKLRDDYSQATLLSTGPWKGSPANKDIVARVAAVHAQVWARQRYRTVDPEYALRTLGEVPQKGREAFQLWKLLPPEGHAELGFFAEDPLLTALKDGQSILWSDWQIVFSYALTRAQRTRAEAADAIRR